MPICHVLVHVLPLIGSPAPELRMFPKLAQPELVTSNVYTLSVMNANNDNITCAGNPYYMPAPSHATLLYQHAIPQKVRGKLQMHGAQ